MLTEYFYKFSDPQNKNQNRIYAPYYTNVYHYGPIDIYKRVINPLTGKIVRYTLVTTVETRPLNFENLWVRDSDNKNSGYIKYNSSSLYHTDKELFTRDSNGKITQAYPDYPNLKTPSKPIKFDNCK